MNLPIVFTLLFGLSTAHAGSGKEFSPLIADSIGVFAPTTAAAGKIFSADTYSADPEEVGLDGVNLSYVNGGDHGGGIGGNPSYSNGIAPITTKIDEVTGGNPSYINGIAPVTTGIGVGSMETGEGLAIKSGSPEGTGGLQIAGDSVLGFEEKICEFIIDHTGGPARPVETAPVISGHQMGLEGRIGRVEIVAPTLAIKSGSPVETGPVLSSKTMGPAEGVRRVEIEDVAPLVAIAVIGDKVEEKICELIMDHTGGPARPIETAPVISGHQMDLISNGIASQQMGPAEGVRNVADAAPTCPAGKLGHADIGSPETNIHWIAGCSPSLAIKSGSPAAAGGGLQVASRQFDIREGRVGHVDITGMSPTLAEMLPVGPSIAESSPVGPSIAESSPVGPSIAESSPVGPSIAEMSPVGPSIAETDIMGLEDMTC